jgi:hypothetical protein
MPIIGRKACPDCGFEHAHIKQTDSKLPYRHCPECGMMTCAKNGAQAALLKKGMRTVAGEMPQPPATDNPIVVPKEDPPAAAPAPIAAPAKKVGLWDQLMNPKKDAD